MSPEQRAKRILGRCESPGCENPVAHRAYRCTDHPSKEATSKSVRAESGLCVVAGCTNPPGPFKKCERHRTLDRANTQAYYVRIGGRKRRDPRKGTQTCTLCRGRGHNRRTCTNGEAGKRDPGILSP